MNKSFFLLLFTCMSFGVFGQKKLPEVFSENSKKIEILEIKEGFYLTKVMGIQQFCDLHNIELVKKYRDNYHIIYINEILTLSNKEKIEIYEVDNDWKLSQNISKTLRNKKSFKVSVHTLNGDLFKYDWLSIAPKSKFINRYKNNFTVEIIAKDFQKLIDNKFVTHISKYTTPKVETPVVENDVSVNRINRVHNLYPNIDGEGFVASVKELLFDTTDIDFRNRYILTGIQANELDQHAALIGSVIGGAGNSAATGRGVANAVTLTSSSFLQIFPDDDQIFINNGISVQNHSYGTAIENEYGNEAAAYDLNTNTLSTLVHVFSSGNSGNLTPENGPYAGIPNFANQTGNFKGAKNILTIGAINRDGEIDIRSSKGPAYDGRVKPELVAYAPGGTSDAAALVSGVSILLQEVYQNNNNTIPPSSLVKAALIAGSDDIGPQGIDFESGYGNLNAQQSVELLMNDQIFESAVVQNESRSIDITVPPNTELLKIALTWNDPAANSGDATALINDLDLLVTDSNTNRWLPWVLNSFPNIDSITQPARRMEDHLNNVEFITIENPPEGNYTIQITGNEITSSNQSFSIAYNFIPATTFEWTFPTSINPLISNQENILRWNGTTNINNIGILELNLNNEGWQTLNDQVGIDDGLFRWPIDSIGGNAQLRMTINGEQFTSEAFAISPEILPRVLFNCEEELFLGWNAVPNATAYNVRFLDDRYMEITQTVTDTTALLIKDNFVETFFSVEPVFDNIIGVTGRAFDYELQGVQCYFTNFFAFLADDTSVNATLNLSTSINVRQVIFERTLNNTTSIIGTFSPPFDNLSLTVDDLELIGGNNLYRATIILDDNTQINTEVVDILLPSDDTLILFPNPIQSGENLNVISQGANQTYEIVEFTGRVIARGNILFINDIIEINLQPGLYIFRTIRDGRTIEAKKIIVND